MPKLTDDSAYSLQKLLDRYKCSRDVLSYWLGSSLGQQGGKPCTVLDLLETVGYRKKQSYLTPRQWFIITDHLDPYLKPEDA